jgi:MFS family permease
MKIQTGLRIGWQLSRHIVATIVAFAALLLPPLAPILVVLIPSWLASIALVGLLYFFPVSETDFEEYSILIWFGLPFILAVLSGFAAFIVLSLSAILTFLGILPTALVTEWICWRLAIRSFLKRLASFVVAGICVGPLVSGMLARISLNWLDVHFDLLVWLALALIFWLGFMLAIFLFGLTLLTLDAIKNGSMKFLHKLKGSRHYKQLSLPQHDDDKLMVRD